jgi:hypothetical protein
MKKLAKKAWKKAKSQVAKVCQAIAYNKLALANLVLNAMVLYRVSIIEQKIDQLGTGIAQSLLILYMNVVIMMSEIAAVLEKVLAIVMGNPA